MTEEDWFDVIWRIMEVAGLTLEVVIAIIIILVLIFAK
jgi:hypothetical protein